MKSKWIERFLAEKGIDVAIDAEPEQVELFFSVLNSPPHKDRLIKADVMNRNDYIVRYIFELGEVMFGKGKISVNMMESHFY